MKFFIVGGSGLLGSAAAAELLRRGHRVASMALPPLPEGVTLPPGMELSFGNHLELSDADIEAALSGCDGLVFAAGVDERVEFPPPVHDSYEKYNIAPVERFLRIAKKLGLRRAVILGSYFTHFVRQWPAMRLAERHPYIQARLEQERLALSFEGEGLAVSVLGLPYIFGTQPGRRPVWTILLERILKMPLATFYPRGGTAALTVRQVGQAIAGALERGVSGPVAIGWENLGWRDMLGHFHRAMGVPERKIITVPTFTLKLWMVGEAGRYRKLGVEPGLAPRWLPELLAAEAFVDRATTRDLLGVTDDDLGAAIADSVRLSLEALEGRRLLEMRAE